MTAEETAFKAYVLSHIHRVSALLHKVAKDLLDRADAHDLSKIESPELEILAKAKPLAGMTYGSAEFEEQKKKDLGIALAHHYARNRHHPEHFKSGILDMTLIDLIEMICDWKASSEQHHDGNIRKSITTNAARFNISADLTKILENTAADME